jgi:pSer/pThr/pTyr-binding forkhead associated (FHA) protein
VNEGIIKFEFKKPDNEPPYRAILKNNNTVRIGKAENSHIKLNNQSISSYHAQIKYEEGRFLMYDCNTRTGTWLRLSSKGVRSADRKLSKLDIVRISSKKTFLIQDVTERIEFACCSEANKWKYETH